jgi:putative hemolysin
MRKKIIIISVIILLLFIALITYLFFDQNSKPAPEIITNGIKATFNCQDQKFIKAEFFNQTDSYVDLLLSDGRNFQLKQAISASGARYANPDESVVFWNKGNTAFILENDNTTYIDCVDSASQANLANPASTNCQAQGGQLVLVNKPDGSQYGLCYFDDNRACEEWAMLRGDCPIGGVKTTGYDTEAQKFCAWSGGSTLAVEGAICTFKDGTTCLADDFYNAKCTNKNN